MDSFKVLNRLISPFYIVLAPIILIFNLDKSTYTPIQFKPDFSLWPFSEVPLSYETAQLVLFLIILITSIYAFFRDYSWLFPKYLTVMASFNEEDVNRAIMDITTDKIIKLVPSFSSTTTPKFDKKKTIEIIRGKISKQLGSAIDFSNEKEFSSKGIMKYELKVKDRLKQEYTLDNAWGMTRFKFVDEKLNKIYFHASYNTKHSIPQTIKFSFLDIFSSIIKIEFTQTIDPPDKENSDLELITLTKMKILPFYVIGTTLYLAKHKNKIVPFGSATYFL